MRHVYLRQGYNVDVIYMMEEQTKAETLYIESNILDFFSLKLRHTGNRFKWNL
jgi:hypothetical protein